MTRLIFTVAFLLSTPNLPAQGNLILNGSFESIGINGAHYWTGAIAYNQNWSNAPHGRNYASIGNLSQNVPTVAGLFYSLTFYAASDLYVNEVGSVEVSWDGVPLPPLSTIPHTYDPQQNRDEQIVWEKFTIDSLLATSDRTTLGISAINSSIIFIDDIRLVPEPSTVVLFGLGIVLCPIAEIRRRSRHKRPTGT